MEAEITAPAQWHFHDENQTSLQMVNHEIAGTSPLTSCDKEDFYQTGISERSPRKSTKSYPLDSRLRRIRANNRERRRIQAINDAMEALRKVIPNTNGKRKLTKLELLRLAQDYIRDLSEILCSNRPEYEEQIVNVNCNYQAYNSFFTESFYTN